MKKKNIALSTLLLSHTLAQLSAPVVAQSYHVQLSKNVVINHKPYQLLITLFENQLKEYEFEGQAKLLGENLNAIIGEYDSDGNVVFQKVSQEKNKVFYQGMHCSSSFTDCEEFKNKEKFFLIHDQEKNTWSIEINTVFTQDGVRNKEIGIIYEGQLDSNSLES